MVSLPPLILKMLHVYRRKQKTQESRAADCREAGVDGGLLGRWGMCHISVVVCVGLAGIVFRPAGVRRHRIKMEDQ